MSLRIAKAGICTSVQDGGRYGYQALGIGPGGAMDTLAAAVADFLVGNEAVLPVLEMGFPAATIGFTEDAVIAITGADFAPLLNGVPVPMWKPIAVQAGMELRFAQKCRGNWCYLGVQGGFAVTPWLNSYATHIRAGAGGYKGRLLKTGDLLPVHRGQGNQLFVSGWGLGPDWQRWYGKRVAVLPGADWCRLSQAAQSVFTGADGFVISARSDRMGYQLGGPAPGLSAHGEQLSTAVVKGTLQLLPSGSCIALMADHQTTGGYPQVGTIVRASLPAFVQQDFERPFSFLITDSSSAEDALFSMHEWLQQLRAACLYKYDLL